MNALPSGMRGSFAWDSGELRCASTSRARYQTEGLTRSKPGAGLRPDRTTTTHDDVLIGLQLCRSESSVVNQKVRVRGCRAALRHGLPDASFRMFDALSARL